MPTDHTRQLSQATSGRRASWLNRLALLAAVAGAGVAADPAGAPQQLRGFGTITMTSATMGGLALTSFACESPERATVLLHKLGRDLAQSATVEARWQAVRVGGAEARVLVREGLGAFLPAAIGSTVLVLSAAGDPATAFAGAADRLQGARFFDPAYRYPVYLDKFSHAGIGSWYPSYWGQNTPKGVSNDVDSHFAYARELDLTMQPNNGGFLLRNLLPKIREYGRPYHFAQWQEWSQDLARLAPEELVQPSAEFTAMPSYYGQVSDGGRRLLTYRDWCFQGLVAGMKDDPLLVDWLDPNGEVGPFSNFQYWDVSEGNRRNLVRYLKEERKYTPESLGQAWFGDARRFASWDQVPIPMSYEFYGWRAGDPMASRTWRVHPAEGENRQEGKAWHELVSECPPLVRAGVEKGYHRPDFDDKGWPAFELPGGELGSMFWRTRHSQFWHRGALQVDGAWLAAARRNGRVYLTVAALNTNRGWKNPDRLWVNGQEAASFSRCPGQDLVAQTDVTDLIREGANAIAYLPAAVGVGGPFFLTTRPFEEFPFADSQVNARFRDWRDYISWCVAEKMENTFKAIRAADPDRFIKMHAAEDKHLGIPLQARYGCFGHNTGEGGFFRPWDKRFGFPYGVPTSAEFGGGITTVDGLRRWVGWFTFEGTNAFDNFHNIQEMMYSPAAPVWREYMPYLKLAPRRDLKRPDIALLWSSHNNHLLPRPVPYCFDLGRGDLQSIGYSYVDVNESTIRDGLIRDYPVLWDTGTWIMDPETVRQIAAYVEAGGTFVALQETGRHSYTQRDAWPISELTGFKVREVRPMEGTLAIGVEQPLLKRLAGRTFYNRGKSVDYSDYNYADKCLALDAVAEGTTTIARYGDGATAIGMRTLGKGRVIVLGSPFWRDSYDGAGMWWPGESQSRFLEDILAGIGVKPLATCDSHDIWREHYLATNGTEEYLALFNPFKEPRTVTVEWTTVQPAGALYDPKDGKRIEGAVAGRSVKLEKITLAGLETRIVATQPAQPPAQAVGAWFAQLARWWRPSAPGAALQRPDLPLYVLPLAATMTGRVVEGAQAAGIDAAALSRTAAPGKEWVRWAGQSVEELRNRPDAGRRVFLHCPIDLPGSWKPGERIDLVVSTFGHGVGDVVGPVDVWLNGKQVMQGRTCVAPGYGDLEDGAVVEVGGLLKREGGNALCLVAGASGFVGEVKLRRYPAVAEEIAVAGAFRTQVDADAGLGTATLPGAMTALYGWKDDVEVPAAWKGSRVFIAIDVGDIAGFDSFAINDKVVFHPVNWFKAVTWMDITPWVKFGGANRLTLISKKATREWKPGTVDYRGIRLQRVPAP